MAQQRPLAALPTGVDERRCKITRHKGNYAEKDKDAIDLRWERGVLVLDDGEDRSNPIATRMVDNKCDKVFLELLALFTKQGQTVCALKCAELRAENHRCP